MVKLQWSEPQISEIEVKMTETVIVKNGTNVDGLTADLGVTGDPSIDPGCCCS